jgi:uncharacterized protein YndB with AHSA1/START domain
MSEIKHDILINAPITTVHDALTTQHGLSSWFTKQVEGTGKLGTHWELSFTDQPFFSWHIIVSESNRVVWECLKGPGNAPGTKVEFLLKTVSDKSTMLTIVHQGWERDDPKYQRCVEIWRQLMNHLQHYCETDVAEPAYQ